MCHVVSSFFVFLVKRWPLAMASNLRAMVSSLKRNKEVEETLRWISTLQTIALPALLTADAVDSLVTDLSGLVV